jgi:uncharacterized protein YfdQ (DUF2303 family)
MTDTRTENDAVIEAARRGTDPFSAAKGNVYLVRTDHGVETVDLDRDTPAHRDRPRNKVGTVTVENVAAFAQYYAKHSNTDSEVFADLGGCTITAVLDAHQKDTPRWEQHRLVLKPPLNEHWKTWTARNGIYLHQGDFAEFLEDNLIDIAPAPVDAATMLEIATKFQAKRSVTFSSGAELTSGDISLRYEETTDTSAGTKGALKVPRVFKVALTPFDDVEPYGIEARFRHRIEKGQLLMCFILDRPSDYLRESMKDVVGQVAEKIGVEVMQGAPVEGRAGAPWASDGPF